MAWCVGGVALGAGLVVQWLLTSFSMSVSVCTSFLALVLCTSFVYRWWVLVPLTSFPEAVVVYLFSVCRCWVVPLLLLGVPLCHTSFRIGDGGGVAFCVRTCVSSLSLLSASLTPLLSISMTIKNGI